MGGGRGTLPAGPTGTEQGSGARSTCRGSLLEGITACGTQESSQKLHKAQAKLSCGAGQGLAARICPRPVTAERQPGRPGPPAARSPGMRLQGPVRSRRGPAHPHSWMDPGQEPPARVPQTPPVAQGERHRSRRPSPRPRLLSPSSSQRHAKVQGAREGKLCASGAGVWAGVELLQARSNRCDLSGRRRRLPTQQQVSIKVLVRSLFPPIPGGPSAGCSCSKTRGQLPNPHLLKASPGEGWSRAGRRARGRWLPAFRRDLSVARLWIPEQTPSPRPTSASRRAPGKGGCPVRNGSYWSGIRKQAAAAFPLPANGLL